jgi:hypothetical protein
VTLVVRRCACGVRQARNLRLDQQAFAWNGSSLMQDVTMLLFTAIFFGAAFLYVKACQKLR